MKKYFIIENQIRPDGEVNTSEVARSTFSSALSYYYERCSKMVATNLYTSVHIMLVDERLAVIKRDDLQTAYVANESEE